jgi:hypothetical protein
LVNAVTFLFMVVKLENSLTQSRKDAEKNNRCYFECHAIAWRIEKSSP